MDKQREDKPTSIRLGERERRIVRAIMEMYSRPGLPVGLGGAVKIALHEWFENHRDEIESRGQHGK